MARRKPAKAQLGLLEPIPLPVAQPSIKPTWKTHTTATHIELGCKHDRVIPGLDREFCSDCQRWLVTW